MKKVLLASLAAAAMLASCAKESVVDPTLTENQAISFSPYAGDATTKGAPINSNEALQGTTGSYGSFEVAAYLDTKAYFGFSTVTYSGSAWGNTDKMYWPNESGSLKFAAYYPSGATFSTDPAYTYVAAVSEDPATYTLSFGHTVGAIADQKDLMYAFADKDFTPSTTAESDVTLNFNHALTQIAFTATKSADLAVTVKSIKICNVVNKGAFAATSTTDAAWTLPSTIATTDLTNYAATLTNTTDGVSVAAASGASGTALTSGTDVLMLMPQSLTAWDTLGQTTDDTGAYLAIGCTITHVGYTAAIVDGTIYVPFDTEDIVYTSAITEDEWLAGYKVTYNLDFGGGYTYPDSGTTLPTPETTPGSVPDPDAVVSTLREITYSTSVTAWVAAEEAKEVDF